jgi:Alginate lyase
MRRQVVAWLAGGVAALVVVPTVGAYGAQYGRRDGTETMAAVTARNARVERPAVSGFVHPGVLVSRGQLDLARSKVSAGAEPWKSAYAKMRSSKQASLTWTAKPRATVECGPDSEPNLGCGEETGDAVAAYTDALMWSVTQDRRYADKAIELMDAWSATIKAHKNSNSPLQAGWAGSNWARAGEIIRYTYTGWPEDRINRFAGMLRNVYLPVVAKPKPDSNGNWELIMKDSAISIAVFLDDRTAFDAAVAIWRKRVPAYIYLSKDGPLPAFPPGTKMHTRDELVHYWHGQSTFVDGLSQETCRDFGHTGWGLDAMVHAAETARIQGLDLYGEFSDRITKAFEFHAQYEQGAEVPAWLCGGKIKTGIGAIGEIAYNHLHNRMHLDLPNTRRLVESRRPAGTDRRYIAWETLTHASNP